MKKLYTLSLCFALLVLVACGENWYGSSSGGGSDIKSLRLDAENAFRDGKYKKSYEICENIVKKDPTSSFGYYGMAKAGLWQHKVSPLSIFNIIKPDGEDCPFMVDSVKVRNNYLQAMKKIFDALTELNRRDSLTALWEFHERAKENKGWDTTFEITVDDKPVRLNLNERLAYFRKTFCGNSPSNNCSDTIGKRKSFPISDREYTSSYFGGILLLSSFSQWFLNVFDINKDGCLTRNGDQGKDNPGDPIKNASEWAKWGCSKDKDGKFSYDLSISVKCPKDEFGNMNVIIDSKQILEDLENELKDYYKDISKCTKDCEKQGIPDQIGDLNSRIDDFGDDFSYVENILNGMGLGESINPDDPGIMEEINKYKAYSSFYKMGVHYDVDGDGCIDEELLDGIDNDGDGFINENSRLSPTDPSDEYYGLSPMNNSMYGSNRYRDKENEAYNKLVRLYSPINEPDKRVRICNDSKYQNCPVIDALESDPDSVTVLGFTQIGYPDYPDRNRRRYWTTNNADLKLKVAQDKDCGKDGKGYDLQFRIDNIGGCWPYYCEGYDRNDKCIAGTKFKKYYCKQE